MVVCRSGQEPVCGIITDGVHELAFDVPEEKGGKHAGFQPFSLLESALAACINITLRKYAETRAIKLSDVRVKVSINRDNPNQVVVNQEVQLVGDLTEKERKTLVQVAKQCPVKNALSKGFAFQLEESVSEIAINPAAAGK